MGSAMYGNCVILATNLEEICTELPYFWKIRENIVKIESTLGNILMVPQQVSE